MKKILLVFLAIAVVTVGYWLISPLFIERQVSESLSDIMPVPEGSPTSSVDISEPQEISSGTFVSLVGHSAEGTARLLQIGDRYFVRFEDDFRVTNGPDLFVHFGKDDGYLAEARLGALKGNVGSQNYEVPAELNPEDYNEVWVWCRAFSVPFGKAVLQ